MSVTNQIPRDISTAAPGATSFAYEFKVISKFDLLVQVNGVTKTVDSDYTVTGVGLDAGGDVNFTAPLVGGETVLRKRNMEYSRDTDYQNLGDLRSPTLNNDQDAPIMMIQQLAEALGRALQLPLDFTGSAEIPAIQALMPLVGNAAGNGLEWGDTTLTGDMLLRPNLAQSGGSNLVGFLQSQSTIARTVLAKMRERVSVLDFIPVAQHAAIKAGTTTYDATANIQDAIDSLSGGGELHFPCGTYRITAELTVSNIGVCIRGDNRWTTTIRQDTLNARILNITNQYCAVSSLGLTYGTGTPTNGATAIRSTGFFNHFADLTFKRSYNGLELVNGNGQKIRDFEMLEYENAGVVVQNCSDIYIARAVFNAGTQARGIGGGLRLTDKAEGIFVTDIDILSGKYSLVTGASVYGGGTRPAYNTFTNCLFDTAAEGSTIGQMVLTEFVSCWWSGGRTGAGFNGLSISQSDSLKFTNCRWFQNGAHGCLVQNTALRTQFLGCSFESNSATTGSGVSHGLVFAASTTDFSVVNCIAHNGLGVGSQGYGIFINNSCDRFQITDCNLAGNVTGAISDGSASTAERYIAKNIGYLTQRQFTTTVLVGATSRTGQHLLPYTPTLDQIIVVPTGDPNASGVVRWWVSGITANDFVINVNAAVSGVAFPVAVLIRGKGA